MCAVWSKGQDTTLCKTPRAQSSHLVLFYSTSAWTLRRSANCSVFDSKDFQSLALQGCQSPDTPPNCDAGAGKVWKHLGCIWKWSHFEAVQRWRNTWFFGKNLFDWVLRFSGKSWSVATGRGRQVLTSRLTQSLLITGSKALSKCFFLTTEAALEKRNNR